VIAGQKTAQEVMDDAAKVAEDIKANG
jgi:hypothetical protein